MIENKREADAFFGKKAGRGLFRRAWGSQTLGSVVVEGKAPSMSGLYAGMRAAGVAEELP